METLANGAGTGMRPTGEKKPIPVVQLSAETGFTGEDISMLRLKIAVQPAAGMLRPLLPAII